MEPVHGYLQGYPGVNYPPGLFQDPRGLRAFVCRSLGYLLIEVGEEIVLLGWTLGVIEWETRARHEVALVIPQGRSVEAPQYHLVVGVVSGVPDGHILEQMIVRPKDIVHPGPHLLASTEHDPCTSILRPWKLVREEVFRRVLKSLLCHRCRYCLAVFVSVQ